MPLREFRSGSKKKTARVLVVQLRKVVAQYFPGTLADLVLGFCTDSASNMRTAYQLVQQFIPRMPSFGCFTHKLNWISRTSHKFLG